MRSYRSVDVAVVLQAKLHPVAKAGLRGAARRDRELLLRQRHADGARADDLSEIERHAAEAAADVEDALPLLDQQLGGEVALLGELGLLERLALVLEIGAGILLVGVEEEAVEPAVVIVVPLDVGLGALAVVAPLESAQRDARLLEQLDPPRSAERHRVLGGERDEIVEVAFDELEAAVHVELAERQLGVQQELALRGAIGDADGDLRPGAVAKSTLRAVAGFDLQMAVTDQFVEKKREKTVHGAPLGPANIAAEGPRARRSKGQVYNWARRKFNIAEFPPPFRRIAKRRALTRLARAPISAADLSRGAEKDAKPSVSALLSSPPPRSPDGSRREVEPAGDARRRGRKGRRGLRRALKGRRCSARF